MGEGLGAAGAVAAAAAGAGAVWAMGRPQGELREVLGEWAARGGRALVAAAAELRGGGGGRGGGLPPATTPRTPPRSPLASQHSSWRDARGLLTGDGASPVEDFDWHTCRSGAPEQWEHEFGVGEAPPLRGFSPFKPAERAEAKRLGGARAALEKCRQEADALPYRTVALGGGTARSSDEQWVGRACLKALEKRENMILKGGVVPRGIHTWDPSELESCGRVGERVIASPMNTQPFSPTAAEAQPRSGHNFRMEGGVVRVYEPGSAREPGPMAPGLGPILESAAETNAGSGAPTLAFEQPVSDSDFFGLLHALMGLIENPEANTFAFRRLRLLEEQFSIYQMLNGQKELLTSRAVPHRDFYNVRKVDTHIHHSACMNQKHLLRFMKKKFREEGDVTAISRGGRNLTLKEVLKSLGLTPHDLSVDLLDMHAHNSKNTTFYRFDKFNAKFNPIGGESRLREIFLKTSNKLRGRYLAEITKEVMDDLHSSKYQMMELRVSIYGKSRSEWKDLAAWWWDNQLASTHVVWLVQIPKLYGLNKARRDVENFGEMLANIFEPLFEATENPAAHVKLHAFLQQVVGFDMVDDESVPERRVAVNMRKPIEWDLSYDPPYAYYVYYVYANLFALNRFREMRGFSGFTLRPHSGEAGDLDHLASTFLLANGVAHGIMLRKSPMLQYLFYLAQVPIYMSPLSNNVLFLEYRRSPFPLFFQRGLNVSLSSDDPLLIHLTKEPLVEEYSIAAQVFKLGNVDMCEIARNSVLHSGFPKDLKEHWVGPYDAATGTFGNDIASSNVPDIRLRFRREALAAELAALAGPASPRD